MFSRKSVAIIGSGAVGSYYGGRLAEAGHEVRFLVRRDYDDIKVAGLTIMSVDGDFRLENPSVFKHSDNIGQVDWVVCALKATAIHVAQRLVRPCVGEKTRVLVLMNGLGLEDDFARWFGAERIFGGLAFTCINRGIPGYVHHYAYGQVAIGHIQDDPDELKEALALWQGSKADIITSSCLLRSRWEKLCWNIPFSGLCVAAGGITTDIILGDPGLKDMAFKLMEEVIQAGNADLEQQGARSRIDGAVMIERMFQRTSTMGAYRPSTMIDFLESRPMEIEAIFGEPLRRALSLNLNVPHLTMLTALLRSLNRNR